MTAFDWNDLRAFLAVAREGSTLGAAKVMGVNQTTVARRIEALEQSLALKLFERGQTGSRLTLAGQDILGEAERVEQAVATLDSRAAAHQRGMAGVIRLTATESIANSLLTPALAEFRRLYPDITVELVITDLPLDLSAGEADVALRGVNSMLADSNLVSRKLIDFVFALYCSRSYALQRGGVPRTPEELRDHALIAGEGNLRNLPALKWMADQAPDAEIACRSNSMTNLVFAIKAGLGVAPLVTLQGDLERDLVRCFKPEPEIINSLYVVTRPDLKDTPRVRAFIDFMAPHVSGLRRRIEAQAETVNAKVQAALQAELEALAQSADAGREVSSPA